MRLNELHDSNSKNARGIKHKHIEKFFKEAARWATYKSILQI